MIFGSKQIRLIEFSQPYELLEDPQSRDLFSQVLTIRKRGYASRHRPYSLAVDTADFVGDHFIIASESSSGLEVLGSYRVVSLFRAHQYRLKFPLFQLLDSSGKSELSREMEFTLLQKLEPKDIEYVSSWTFKPEVKTMPELNSLLKKLVTLMNVSSVKNPSSVRFACGIPRLKTDQYIQWLGYRPCIGYEGKNIEILQNNLQQEPVYLMRLDGHHSGEAQLEAKSLSHYWAERLVLAPSQENETETKSAA